MFCSLQKIKICEDLNKNLTRYVKLVEIEEYFTQTGDKAFDSTSSEDMQDIDQKCMSYHINPKSMHEYLSIL